MSEKALNAILLNSLGSNQRLSALYDFEGASALSIGFVTGPDGNVTGTYPNSIYSNQPSLHTGFLLGATGINNSAVINKATDIFDSSSSLGDKLDLTYGNFQVPLNGLNAADMSVIIDFEFQDGNIDDGIILGCFKTGSTVISSNEIRHSQGFNIGVTDRGHLFCQTYSDRGDSIKVASSIELSKRNLIGVSVDRDIINVSHFDYFNSLTQEVEVRVSEEFVDNEAIRLVSPDSLSLYFGGSDTYFRSTDNKTATFSGSLHGLAIFSGFIDPLFLKELGEGLIGSYFENAAVETSAERVTGYSQTIVYKTGITGYNYNSTGTLEIITGREEFTGSISLTSSESRSEGERYYKYYTLNNGGVKTFYKEELGKLHSNSGYIYYPTGEGAYDTLGLNDVSESIQTYAEVTGITQEKITIDLYGKTPLTGVLSEVSGVTQTALTETVTFVEPASSGVNLTENSDGFKKNYIYYMGGKS
jgi:hypothetical protein